jgi:hypothetical protein
MNERIFRGSRTFIILEIWRLTLSLHGTANEVDMMRTSVHTYLQCSDSAFSILPHLKFLAFQQAIHLLKSISVSLRVRIGRQLNVVGRLRRVNNVMVCHNLMTEKAELICHGPYSTAKAPNTTAMQVQTSQGF